MNAVVSRQPHVKKTMQVVVTSCQSFIIVTSDSTPELNNSFTPIEASGSTSNSRMTPLVHLASSNPEDSDLNLRFLNSIKCNSAHESPPVSWLLSHCLLFFPLQQSNVHVLLFVHPTKAQHLILQIYSPPPLHGQHFKMFPTVQKFNYQRFPKIIVLTNLSVNSPEVRTAYSLSLASSNNRPTAF